MTAESITLNQVIDAHLLLAVANGFYVADMLARNIGSAADAAICARLAFHHAATFRTLRTWADSSRFARPNDSIASSAGIVADSTGVINHVA